MSKTQLGILISGRGSNMQALVKACLDRHINADAAVVLSDNKQAKGLEKAAAYNIHTEVVCPSEYSSKDAYEQALIDVLKQHNVELVCLAGYMRVIHDTLLEAFPNRILNIHPSLLPSFKGLQPQKQALDYGVKFSGCSVHIVNKEIDGGPILQQEVVPVYPDDTEELLSKRILEQEHILYPKAIQKFIYELSKHKKEEMS